MSLCLKKKNNFSLFSQFNRKTKKTFYKKVLFQNLNVNKDKHDLQITFLFYLYSFYNSNNAKGRSRRSLMSNNT